MKLLFSFPGDIEWLIVFGVAALFLIPQIFYMLMLQNTLKLISPGNRAMKPGQVWFLLIPVANIVYHFFVVKEMATSIAAEAAERGLPIGERQPGYNLGQPMCVLSCLTWIPVIGTLASLGALVTWILYWIKINEYRKMLLYAPQRETGDLL